MWGVAAAVLWSACGVEAGWQTGSSGELEYVLHLDEAALEALARGEEIASDVPSEIGTVRAVRLRRSGEAPPREAIAQTALRPPAPPPGTPLQRTLPAPGPGDTDEPPADQAWRAFPETSADQALTETGARAQNIPSSVVGSAPSTLPDPSTWISNPNHFAPSQASPIHPTVGAVTRLPPVSTGAQATSLTEQPPAGAAVHERQLDTPSAREDTPDEKRAAGTSPERPWGPLLAAVTALFASFGGNLFLGWTTWGLRTRYRQLVTRVRNRLDELDGAWQPRERAFESLGRSPLSESHAARRDRR